MSDGPTKAGSTASDPRSEAALRTQHAWLRDTLTSMGDAVITTDNNGCVTFLNPVAQTLTGWTQSDAVGQPLEAVFKIIHEETRLTVENPVSKAFREGVIVTLADYTLLVAKDGTERSVGDSAAPIHSVAGVVAGAVLVFRDVSERRRQEQELRDALAYADSIIATICDPFVVLDQHLRVVTANRSFYETFRVAPEETQGHFIHALGNSQWNIPQLRTLLEEVLPQDHTFQDFEVEHEFPIVGLKVMRLNARRIFEPGSHSNLILLAIEDITERTQAEVMQREREERFRQILDALPSAVYTTDAEGRLTYFNPAAIEISGRTPELDGELWSVAWKLYRPDGTPLPIEECPMSVALREGRAIRGQEIINERPDGTRNWLAVYPTPLRNDDGKLIGSINMAVNITDRKQAELATGTLAAIVESSEEAIVSLTLDGTITSWNKSATNLYGHNAVDALGKNISLIIPADLRQEENDVIARVRRGEKVESFETERVAKDGRRVRISLTVSPVRDPLGKIIGASKISHDVTKQREMQRQLEISEMRYRRLFEAAHDGILILDAVNHKITHVNPFLLNLLDYPAEHFLGKELWEIGVLSDKQASRSAIRQLSEEGSIRYESLPLEDRHGQTHPVEMVANLYREDQHPVIQCNIRDISERSRLEKLQQAQAAELTELHRRKDEFLAMLSHELRSPLAPIANAVQLLGLQQGSENRIQQQARGIIERQLKQLQHLVDDLLEVSRITTGRLQLRKEPAIVSKIVEGAVETIRPLIELRRHELTLSLPSEPIWLDADVSRLEQVIVNLVTNAAKYTDVGGRIWLTVRKEGEQCVLRVRDTGVGIARSLLPLVFDLFTQSERSLDRSEGGLGIGLALVKRLTELHGGTVEAHSTLGEGSEFVVRLPVMTSADVPSASSVTQVGRATVRPLRVLVVDDNVDTVMSLSMLLKAAGHEVRTAQEGLSAVQIALEFLPDVVSLDIGLPGLNGYEVAHRIRAQSSLKHVVLIAVTGYGRELDRQTTHQAGFDYHLVKPARLAELQQILATVAEAALPPRGL